MVREVVMWYFPNILWRIDRIEKNIQILYNSILFKIMKFFKNDRVKLISSQRVTNGTSRNSECSEVDGFNDW